MKSVLLFIEVNEKKYVIYILEFKRVTDTGEKYVSETQKLVEIQHLTITEGLEKLFKVTQSTVDQLSFVVGHRSMSARGQQRKLPVRMKQTVMRKETVIRKETIKEEGDGEEERGGEEERLELGKQWGHVAWSKTVYDNNPTSTR